MVHKVFQKLFVTQYKRLYLLLWTQLLILKMLIETLLKILFSVIGRCSLVPTSHWLQGKGARINLSLAASFSFTESQAASCKHFLSVKIAASGSLKRVTGRIFKISKQFQRCKLKLWVWSFHHLTKQKLMKTISACTESIYWLL